MESRKSGEVKRNVQSKEEKAKKPYEKPRIIYHAPLEAMANLCLPAPPGKAGPGCSSIHS